MDGTCPLLRQPDSVQGFAHPPGNDRCGNAQVLRAEGDLVFNSSLNELGIRVLKDDSDAPRDFCNLGFKRVNSPDANDTLPLSASHAGKVSI
ncbi:hypothetical protein D3C85_1515530 [compost metagenome]